jgi:hypothetical protein
VQVNIPEPVVGLQEWLNLSVPDLLQDFEHGAIVRDVRTNFDSQRQDNV